MAGLARAPKPNVTPSGPGNGAGQGIIRHDMTGQWQANRPPGEHLFDKDPASSASGTARGGVSRGPVYTPAVVGLIILLALAAAMVWLMWWAVGQPPTRPRPDSRHRGATYMSVHRRLRRRGRSK